MIVDLTCDTADSSHADRVVEALKELPGVEVRKVSDRTFLLHLGGKIEVSSKVALRNRDELSRAYTPGVARVCLAIAENPDDARRLTIKRNTVAVVTDGSAVLGLGNIGPAAALPVMEGKAALFKRFGGVDAWPVVLDTQDVDEIVSIVRAIAPAYGGINLEDIAAPRCFEIETRLRDLLDIPVFHDDQHGTAICVLAALTNALRVVGKELADVRVVVSGAGAAGTAIMKLLLRQGVGDIIACDRPGALHEGMTGLNPAWQWLAEHTNRDNYAGDLAGAIRGADVFIGVSAPNLLDGDDIAQMADGRDRLRAGQPRPGGGPARGAQARRRRRHRPLRPAQPDQQRAGLPGRLPGHARRPRPGVHRGDGPGRGPGDRGRGRRGAAQPHGDRPERLRHPGGAGRRRGRPGRGPVAGPAAGRRLRPGGPGGHRCPRRRGRLTSGSGIAVLVAEHGGAGRAAPPQRPADRGGRGLATRAGFRRTGAGCSDGPDGGGDRVLRR